MEGKFIVEFKFDDSIFDNEEQKKLFEDADTESQQIFIFERFEEFVSGIDYKDIKINNGK